MEDSICFFNKTIVFIIINLDSEIIIQRIMLQQKQLNKYEISLTKFSSLVESTAIYKKRLIQLTMNFYKRFQSLLGQRLQYILIEESESSLKENIIGSHKALNSDFFYLSSTQTICTIQLRTVKHITLQATQIYC